MACSQKIMGTITFKDFQPDTYLIDHVFDMCADLPHYSHVYHSSRPEICDELVQIRGTAIGAMEDDFL